VDVCFVKPVEMERKGRVTVEEHARVEEEMMVVAT
jgi:hypothetical protein